MSKFKFNLNDDESLIIVNCKVNKHNFSLALDTGATHSIIDLTTLLIIGFTLKDVIKTVQLETGKGIVDAYVFKVNKFSSLDKEALNMEICAYDFIGNSIFSDFEGVLGLDFLRNSELNINFIENTIELK